MRIEEIKIGQCVQCLPVGCQSELIGEILSVHENVVVVEAIDYERCDRTVVIDKQNRLIVKKNKIFQEASVLELKSA